MEVLERGCGEEVEGGGGGATCLSSFLKHAPNQRHHHRANLHDLGAVEAVWRGLEVRGGAVVIQDLLRHKIEYARTHFPEEVGEVGRGEGRGGNLLQNRQNNADFVTSSENLALEVLEEGCEGLLEE